MEACEYCVLEADTAGELTEHVNQAIAKGWKPQGGVQVVRYSCGDPESFEYEVFWKFFQAMSICS